MEFVRKDSIVRKIWGRREVVLFIFAGAAAEFALNKAVDWLYFTGRLPADPIGRLFSTVTYARKIVFSKQENSLGVIDTMRDIHAEVERKRNSSIPDWAYRDVLYMLIHYSIASYEVLERKLTLAEKHEVYDVFFRVGSRMGVKALPSDYEKWLIDRAAHLNTNLVRSSYTDDLFVQYKKHLGAFRYLLLKQAQVLVIPDKVRELLNFPKRSYIKPLVIANKIARLLRIEWWLMSGILPGKYRAQIKALDYER